MNQRYSHRVALIRSERYRRQAAMLELDRKLKHDIKMNRAERRILMAFIVAVFASVAWSYFS